MNQSEFNTEPEARASRKRTIVWSSIVIGLIVVAFASWFIVQNASGTQEVPEAALSASPSTATTSAPSEAPVPTPSPGTETGSPEAPGDGTPQATQPPIDLDAEGTATDGLVVSLTQIEAVEGEPTIPGEIAGPALRVTIQASNDSADTIETPIVVVNLEYGSDQSVGNQLLQPGGQPFPAKVDAGSTESGIYVFSVPIDQRDDIRIEVNMLFESSVIVFQGAVS